MKLLNRLRQKIAEEQQKTANLFAKAIGFNSIHDSTTVIEKKDAEHAWKFVKQNRQLLMDSFPKENVKKLLTMDEVSADTDVSEILIVFKQILRAQRCRMISRKRYDWCTVARRQKYELEYRIISSTPDPTPTTNNTPTPTPPVPKETVLHTQTTETNISNTNTSTTEVPDIKVSNVIDTTPPVVVENLKRKLSPTPAPVEQPLEKKPKVEDKEITTTHVPNEMVPDVPVLKASPTMTVPPSSPNLDTLDALDVPSPSHPVGLSPGGAQLSSEVPILAE